MAIIPLKQTAYIRKYTANNNNGWAEDDYAEEVAVDVRATEKFETITDRFGETVISSVKLTFDKFPDLNYDDMFRFTNENGITIESKPLSIRPVRMINGKAVLTTVYL